MLMTAAIGDNCEEESKIFQKVKNMYKVWFREKFCKHIIKQIYKSLFEFVGRPLMELGLNEETK